MGGRVRDRLHDRAGLPLSFISWNYRGRTDSAILRLLVSGSGLCRHRKAGGKPLPDSTNREPRRDTREPENDCYSRDAVSIFFDGYRLVEKDQVGSAGDRAEFVGARLGDA